MRELQVTKNEAGQRLDKLLAKYFRLAPQSFYYKMLRKKNITLNGARAQGDERLVEGDRICFFLAEETFARFGVGACAAGVDVRVGADSVRTRQAEGNDAEGKNKGSLTESKSKGSPTKSKSKESPTEGKSKESPTEGKSKGSPTESKSKGSPTEGKSRRDQTESKNKGSLSESKSGIANATGEHETANGVKAVVQAAGGVSADVLRAAKEIRAQGLVPRVIYEDAELLLLDKPCGLLTQRASAGDASLNEWVIAYLLETGTLTERQLLSFRPAVCNRLDRNTSGLVIAGKTLPALQMVAELIRTHQIEKWYRCVVWGRMTEGGRLDGYLVKDTRRNRVRVLSLLPEEAAARGAARICTEYRPLCADAEKTLLEVRLITGKTHQIRSHLASISHPLLGDEKYGDRAKNAELRVRVGLTHQLLHAYRLTFRETTGALAAVSGQTFTAPLPELFERLVPTGETQKRRNRSSEAETTQQK